MDPFLLSLEYLTTDKPGKPVNGICRFVTGDAAPYRGPSPYSAAVPRGDGTGTLSSIHSHTTRRGEKRNRAESDPDSDATDYYEMTIEDWRKTENSFDGDPIRYINWKNEQEENAQRQRPPRDPAGAAARTQASQTSAGSPPASSSAKPPKRSILTNPLENIKEQKGPYVPFVPDAFFIFLQEEREKIKKQLKAAGHRLGGIKSQSRSKNPTQTAREKQERIRASRFLDSALQAAGARWEVMDEKARAPYETLAAEAKEAPATNSTYVPMVRNPFMMFMKERRKEIRRQLIAAGATRPTAARVSKVGSATWEEMDEELKKPYIKMTAGAKEARDAKIAEIKANGGTYTSRRGRPKKKRAKTGSSCTMCHKRKVKCKPSEEEGAPCKDCARLGFKCTQATTKDWAKNRKEWARRREEAKEQTGSADKGRAYSNLFSTRRYKGPCNETGCILKKAHGGKHVYRR